MSAGAYGAVQAGTYNSRLLVPEIMVEGEKHAVIRPRGDYDAFDRPRQSSALVDMKPPFGAKSHPVNRGAGE